MPIALLFLLIDLLLIFHASRTGRLQPWAFIILMIPGIGALAYVVVELVPELLNGPGAHQARRRVISKLNPEKHYRELIDRLDATDTVANRAALAAECLELGRFDEAEQHYSHILKLPLGSEPAFALGKAKADFGLNRPAAAIATMDDLQARWPRPDAPRRPSTNSTPLRPISPARRRGSATACCWIRWAAPPRPR